MSEEGLEFQNVDIRFDKGLDTRTQNKLVVAGKWTQLENLTLAKDYTLQRRPGVGLYAVPPFLSINGVLNGLATYNNELVVITGSSINTVTPSISDAVNVAPASMEQVTGSLGFVSISKQEVYRSSGLQWQPDCATLLGWTAYVWVEQDGAGTQLGVNILISDETTGAKIYNTYVVLSATAICPRIVSPGDGAFYVFWIEPATNSLNCRVYVMSTTAQPTVGAVTALVTSASLNTIPFDACAAQDSGGTAGVYVIYGWADGTTSLRGIAVVRNVSTPFISGGQTNLVANASYAAAAIKSMSVCVSFSTNAMVGAFIWGTAGLYGVTVNTSLAVVHVALLDATASTNFTNHVTSIWHPALLQFWVFTDFVGAGGFSSVGGSFLSPLRVTKCTDVLGTVTTTTILNTNTFASGSGKASGPQGPFICGKPFFSGSDQLQSPFLPLCVNENYSGLTSTSTNNTTNINLQNSFFLADGNSGRIVSKALYGACGVQLASTPCSSPAPSTGGWLMLAQEVTTVTFAGGGNAVRKPNLCRLNFNPNYSTAPIAAQLGQSLFFAGGVLSTYDGGRVVEHGFDLFPEGLAVGVTAGGAMTAGVHQVVAVYEWVDNAGQRHQSAPSTPQTPGLTISAGNQTLTCVIPTLQLTQKTNVRIVLYCTLANGLTFYRVTSYAGTTMISGLLNDQTLPVVQTTITSVDSDLAGNEVLYTQPSQATSTLPNNQPPPCNALTVHQNRLFIDAADSPFAWRYSQQLTMTPSGPVGLQFNETLGGVLGPESGGIVAFKSLDEKLIIFCARKIYVVYGTGPQPNGSASSYSDPQVIPVDVGCSEARSVVAMPLGIIFKSAKGWYLLGRDLTTKYIGAGVAAYDSFPVSSAVLLENREEIRFSCPTNNSTTAGTLVYCYAVDQWAVSTFRFQFLTFNSWVTAAVWWPTVGAYMSTMPQWGVMQDSASSLEDNPGYGGSPVVPTTKAQLSFLKMQSMNGFQRARWLYITGVANGAPNSSLTIGVDYDDAYSNATLGSYSVAVALGGVSFPATTAIDLRHKLRRQKCKTVSFTFTETGVTGNTLLKGIQALTLRIGLKKGTNKLPAAQGVG